MYKDSLRDAPGVLGIKDVSALKKYTEVLLKSTCWRNIMYSNTPRLYSQWLNSVIYSATNHWVKARDAIWHRSDAILTLLTSVFVSTTLDVVTSLFRVNNVRNACKQQRYSQNYWRGFLIRWRTVGRIWRVQLRFRRFLCVRIEIDQLLCVICWVINHSLSVSCK